MGWPLCSTLQIFEKARSCMPTLELHVCRTTGPALPPDDNPQIIHAFKRMSEEILRRLTQPGVTEFDAINVEDEFKQAAIWCHPTHHPDCLEDAVHYAQRYGAIPVFTPVGVAAARCFAGVPICGIAALDRLIVSRFAYEIVQLASKPEYQECIRVPMMEQAAEVEWAVPYERTQEILARAMAIQGWMAEPELTWLIEAAARADSVVEIGCWRGRSTYALASACKGEVFAVDHWQGGKDEPEHIKREAAESDLYAEFCQNIISLRVIPIKNESIIAAQQVRLLRGGAGVVFIDGGHGYDEVRSDIRAWLPVTQKLICGHDYDWQSVRDAVRDELGEVRQGPGSIWYKQLETEVQANAAD